eukprot:CAMPEP_0181483608 /NCGR_PEP_ID=MMETSP1110-20121109/45517_1 /TAXON_ID=174948 /ORGANISM="Symbiodinium sp., Strain CCMP421" /LENGTH=132 /DNA_ID=CAMNT_0023609341 /DNA_START=45 /DNA_END=439 /DNA_ORIENTATION=-
MAADAEDNAWLVDMIIQFMHSPSWNDPINAFIAERCTSFDNFEEEMKHEYMELHNEFRGLVDNLLTAHLLEVDISPEDFEKQVMESGLAQDERMQRLVSQLVAAVKMQQEAEGNFRGMSPEEERAANDAAIA